MSIALPDIAERARCSVQTILRQFGSRDALFDAAESFAEREVLAERETVPGEVSHALETIVDHYELRGDGVLLLLGQERLGAARGHHHGVGEDCFIVVGRKAFGPLLPGCGTGNVRL